MSWQPKDKLAALSVLLGLVTSASLGSMREPLDLPGPSGFWTETLEDDEGASEPSPGNKARSTASTDLAPAALLPDDVDPPPDQPELLSPTDCDRCSPGYRSSIDRPPRLAL